MDAGESLLDTHTLTQTAHLFISSTIRSPYNFKILSGNFPGNLDAKFYALPLLYGTFLHHIWNQRKISVLASGLVRTYK